jgi:hypothetical protein
MGRGFGAGRLNCSNWLTRPGCPSPCATCRPVPARREPLPHRTPGHECRDGDPPPHTRRVSGRVELHPPPEGVMRSTCFRTGPKTRRHRADRLRHTRPGQSSWPFHFPSDESISSSRVPTSRRSFPQHCSPVDKCRLPSAGLSAADHTTTSCRTDTEKYPAARNYPQLCRRGRTARKTIDCVIATLCVRGRRSLLHADPDFDAFEGHLGLHVVRP